MKDRLAELPVIGRALRVQERFGEIQGTALANGIALQSFLSIFPLLLVAIAVLGFIAHGNPDLADDVIEELSLEGNAADQLRTAIDGARNSRQATSIVGGIGLLFSGLNLVTAIQRTVDAAWQTFGKGLANKAKAFLWLGGAVVLFAATFAVTVLINFLPSVLSPLSILVGFGISVALFLWTFNALSRVPVGWRARLPGAIFCAVGFEILKIVGGVYVPMLVANSQALYGSLGVVFALLAWLAIFGRVVVYGSVLNVVAWEETNGTVTVPIEAPRVEGAIALSTNRAGRVTDRLE